MQKQKIDEVSARLHYLIKDGVVPLPAFGKAEVLLQQARLMVTMRKVLRSYLDALADGDYGQASVRLGIFRYLEEGSCKEQFEKYGYPEQETSAWDELISEYQADKATICVHQAGNS